MPKEVKLKDDEAAVKFVNATFTAYSEERVVPADSVVVLPISGNTYKLYAGDRKVIQNEGVWLLDGVEQAPPVFSVEKEEGFITKANGTVVIQGLGQGDYVESHLHRWQWLEGTSEVGAPIGCVHFYGDGIRCDTIVTEYGLMATTPWASRYYHKEGKAK